MIISNLDFSLKIDIRREGTHQAVFCLHLGFRLLSLQRELAVSRLQLGGWGERGVVRLGLYNPLFMHDILAYQPGEMQVKMSS